MEAARRIIAAVGKHLVDDGRRAPDSGLAGDTTDRNLGDNAIEQNSQGLVMKSFPICTAVVVVSLMHTSPVGAQQGPMRAPTMPQAIGTHIDQVRTLQQREAIEAEKAGSLPRSEVAPEHKQASPKRPVIRPSRKTARPSAAHLNAGA